MMMTTPMARANMIGSLSSAFFTVMTPPKSRWDGVLIIIIITENHQDTTYSLLVATSTTGT